MKPLTDDDRARYEWQMWIDGLGEEGQRRLKNATVAISRLGGVGGTVAYYLAAAGVGRLVLAHGGHIRADDLHRQLLMTTDAIGQPRIESARQRLHELNPHVEIIGYAENLSEENAERILSDADLLVGAAPLFRERFLLNTHAVRLGKPLVDCAMFDMEGQVTTIIPDETPCLACLYPEEPPAWKREFPVLGSVSGTAATIGATEVVKLITGIGQPLAGRLLTFDLRAADFRTITIHRRPRCEVCGVSGEVM